MSEVPEIRSERFRSDTPLIERFLLHVAFFASFPIWILSIAWLVASQSALADIITHASLHIWVLTTVVLAFASTVFLFRRHQTAASSWLRRVVLLAGPWLLMTAVTLPWQAIPIAKWEAFDGKRTKILAWNALLMNFEYDEVEKAIRNSDADIVVIFECNAELGNHLQELRTDYVDTLWSPMWHSQGIIVMTKLKDTKLEFQRINGLRAANIKFKPHDSSIVHNLLAMHTYSPRWPGNRVFERNQQLIAAAQWAAGKMDQPVILMGDLNTSPWSPVFRQMLRTGALGDTRRFHGYYSSWPAYLGDYGIPIDHVLVNDQVKVVERSVWPEGHGSDHRAVTLDIH